MKARQLRGPEGPLRNRKRCTKIDAGPTQLLGPTLFDLPLLPSMVLNRSAERADARQLAVVLAEGHVLALVRGRTEFGPRALGHRSLVA